VLKTETTFIRSAAKSSAGKEKSSGRKRKSLTLGTYHNLPIGATVFVETSYTFLKVQDRQLARQLQTSNIG